MQTFPRDDGTIPSQRAHNQSAARATEVSNRTGNESRSRRKETFQHMADHQQDWLLLLFVADMKQRVIVEITLSGGYKELCCGDALCVNSSRFCLY